MRYTVVTTDGPVDIGDFPDQASAEDQANNIFGSNVRAVIPQIETSVTVTATPPPDYTTLLAGAAVLVALYSFSKPRRKTR